MPLVGVGALATLFVSPLAFLRARSRQTGFRRRALKPASVAAEWINFILLYGPGEATIHHILRRQEQTSCLSHQPRPRLAHTTSVCDARYPFLF
uniref:Putative secreted protein n=1 Tax=Anopheles darlingi TaxID=43151 RepID=A0A2M4DDA5_ANODA